MALLNDKRLIKYLTKRYIRVNDHWIVDKETNGYGKAYANGRTWQAHRLSYELFVGPIPLGLQLDHLCRITNCINPEHLEPVTPAENKRRAMKVHCKRGHKLSGNNISTNNGTRQCLKCRALREANRRQKVRVSL